MQAKNRDVVIGLSVLVVLITAAFLIKNSLNKKALIVAMPTPSIEQKLEKNFPGLTIPDDVEKVELKDVSGGEAFGVATKSEILANLPDLQNGQVYKGWLENSEGKTVLLGNFRVAKAGWILEYKASDYPGYNKIIVTLGDKHLLEGSF